MLVSVLKRQFPDFPATREQVQSRVAQFVFVVCATAIAAYVHPLARTLALGALLAGFAGATILWWESNSGHQDIEGVVRYILRSDRARETTAERIFGYVFAGLTWAVWVVANLRIAGLAYLWTYSRGFYAIIVAEAKVGVFVAVALAAMLCMRWYSDWQMGRLRREVLSHPGERQEIARRAMRTWGFMLIGAAAMLQIYPTWISFMPGP